MIGFAGGAISALPVNRPLLKSAALVGVDIRHFLASKPREAQIVRTALFADVASGSLAAPQVVPFRLARAKDALDALAGRDRIGKVVVTS
ncbi:hypothetical protein [Methylobacterium haplocladii]|uniref:Alcohol dehydrogenase-like C-terminal domain-containing protein n=1 Tax=Methylobacterium haplocladii TaxID=1176176 RepID=A0A512ISP2_9HYPH|nr:hypothetical protein [Methylobacterium haplocladii]GEP00734.1 hypothetical protein MHA02_31210 [Methylobacterium haplocladii]GJD82427.1 hypothetical protein HPGCJGGD_0281 [Methylobacterium haplocladii]GLS59539.1 hypothetical protein GCM10007887_22080 [Methylobacterium haplocladii]